MEEQRISTNSVQCGVCHLQRSTSYTCVKCVRTYLQKYWEQLKVISAEKDESAAQANHVFSPTVKRYQISLARRAIAADHASAISEEKKLMLTELEQDRHKLIKLRASLNQRRENLNNSNARLNSSKIQGPPAIANSIERKMERWAVVHERLDHSRRLLIAELVKLFDLKHVPGRRRSSRNYKLDQSPLSTAATAVEDSKTFSAKDILQNKKLSVRDYLEEETWNEYFIVGRSLPTGYFENHNQDEINTTIENVIHMMKLVACYLGIKLPFNIFLKDSRYYVQTAFSMSSKRFPIFLTGSNISQFAVGLGGLNYNIAYLCHSQGVHITLSNATNTLENLLACCEATNLGRYTNYADIMAKQTEGVAEPGGLIEDDAPLSPMSYDGDLEIIKPGTKKAEMRNKYLMWCPGQEPFDLNVNDIIMLIRSRRDEESSVLGEFHLQDPIATGLEETIEDDYFLRVDFDEDGVFDFDPHEAELGLIHSSLSSPGDHMTFKTESSLARNQRRPPHPSRNRQLSQPPSERPSTHSNGGDPASPTKHSKSENWTLLDIDISPVPSSISQESGILSGRGWPDISVLKKVGSAVGGAAVGLVNGASNVAGAASARGSRYTRRIPDRSSSRDSSYSSISSSAP